MQLVEVLRETTAKYSNKGAYVFGKRTYSYADTAARTNQMANRLAELGVRKGDKVALLLPNVPDFPVAYYATLSLGASVVPLNVMYRPREISYILNDAEAKVVITAGAYLPSVLQARSSTPSVQHVIVKGRGAVPRTINLDDLLVNASTKPVETVVTDQDVAAICYTSGTTGDPKGAVLTHANLLANIDQMLRAPRFKVTAEDVGLLVLPLFHIFGMNVGMNLGVLQGTTQVLVERFEVELVARMIQDLRVSVLLGFPSLFVALVNLPTIREYDLSSLRIVSSGAAPLPIKILELFQDLTGVDIMEGYGLTETSPTLTTNAAGAVTKPGSVGPALPGVEIRVVDDHDQDVPVGQCGEIVCRGPNVMREYHKLPGETAQAFRGGWFHTADLATMDEDGYCFLVGRKTDLIKAGGFNVYPREIEEVLCRHPKIREAAAVGVADPYQGEAVVAVVTLRAWQTATEQEIIEYCRENLAAFKAPQHIEFRDALPRSPTGKLLRRQLRSEMAEKRSQANYNRKSVP